MTIAQALLDRLTPLTTPQLEEIHELLKTDDSITGDGEDIALTRSMVTEALEIRDPNHPIVRAEIARHNAAWEAMS